MSKAKRLRAAAREKKLQRETAELAARAMSAPIGTSVRSAWHALDDGLAPLGKGDEIDEQALAELAAITAEIDALD